MSQQKKKKKLKVILKDQYGGTGEEKSFFLASLSSLSTLSSVFGQEILYLEDEDETVLTLDTLPLLFEEDSDLPVVYARYKRLEESLAAETLVFEPEVKASIRQEVLFHRDKKCTSLVSTLQVHQGLALSMASYVDNPISFLNETFPYHGFTELQETQNGENKYLVARVDDLFCSYSSKLSPTSISLSSSGIENSWVWAGGASPAAAQAKPTIFISVRGTQTNEDMHTDLSAFPSFSMKTFEGKIHQGFWRRACLFPIAFIIRLIEAGHQVRLCGHSLGGCIAHIICLRVLTELDCEQSKVCSIASVAFGSPFFATAEVNKYIKKHNFGDHFLTIVNEKDSVPRLLSIERTIDSLGVDNFVSFFQLAPFFPAEVKSVATLISMVLKTAKAFVPNYHPVGVYWFFDFDSSSTVVLREASRKKEILQLLGAVELSSASIAQHGVENGYRKILDKAIEIQVKRDPHNTLALQPFTTMPQQMVQVKRSEEWSPRFDDGSVIYSREGVVEVEITGRNLIFIHSFLFDGQSLDSFVPRVVSSWSSAEGAGGLCCRLHVSGKTKAILQTNVAVNVSLSTHFGSLNFKITKVMSTNPPSETERYINDFGPEIFKIAFRRAILEYLALPAPHRQEYAFSVGSLQKHLINLESFTIGSSKINQVFSRLESVNFKSDEEISSVSIDAMREMDDTLEKIGKHLSTPFVIAFPPSLREVVLKRGGNLALACGAILLGTAGIAYFGIPALSPLLASTWLQAISSTPGVATAMVGAGLGATSSVWGGREERNRRFTQNYMGMLESFIISLDADPSSVPYSIHRREEKVVRLLETRWPSGLPNLDHFTLRDVMASSSLLYSGNNKSDKAKQTQSQSQVQLKAITDGNVNQKQDDIAIVVPKAEKKMRMSLESWGQYFSSSPSASSSSTNTSSTSSSSSSSLVVAGSNNSLAEQRGSWEDVFKTGEGPLLSNATRDSKREAMKLLLAVRSAHYLRKMLIDDIWISVVGVHNAGKSQMIRNLWGFPTNPGGGDVHTVRAVPWRIPGKNFVVVDFPGTTDRNNLDEVTRQHGHLSHYVLVCFKMEHVGQPEIDLMDLLRQQFHVTSCSVLVCIMQADRYPEFLVSREKISEIRQIYANRLGVDIERLGLVSLFNRRGPEGCHSTEDERRWIANGVWDAAKVKQVISSDLSNLTGLPQEQVCEHMTPIRLSSSLAAIKMDEEVD